ncbi:hypothetical protein AB3N61_18650 [Leptospira sp. WS58.C1]|uniref:hypothetical protein n=1 Tax=Leptospira TaxID=171 RepID=UPI0002BDA5CA|nr:MULTISPECIES: hypothetical protein [unclassified Leptospira]EMK00162.1 hypothetical protein LEP1GSC192_3142 [Leptospira sp. B5-022]MCR1795771.1 hypothetical protein [Leptospira sp. id769339]
MVDLIILYLIFSSFSTLSLFIIIYQIVKNPDIVEKWASLIYKLFTQIGIFAGWARKRYIQRDIQSRINIFVRRIVASIPQMEFKKCRIDWVDLDKIDKKTFLENDQVIIRLSNKAEDNENFVHATYHFVSTSLLMKAKRYISPSQRESLDLFVTGKIIEEEKIAVRDYYLENYAFPNFLKASGKIKEYYEKYQIIEELGHFYTILLNELDLIGGKVYGKVKDASLIVEVDQLIEFLLELADKKVGEDKNLNFQRPNSNLAVVIVGKNIKVHETPEVYERYINGKILPNNFNSIYLVGSFINKNLIEQLSARCLGSYEILLRKKHPVKLKYRDGSDEYHDTYTMVLRKRGNGIHG